MESEIKQLIPQREPFLLVTELVSADDQSCTTRFVVDERTALFHNGKLSEAGVIEHQAQSAAALSGYLALRSGATQPPLGMIGELKSLQIYALPQLGDCIETHVTFGLSVGNITVATAQTYLQDQLIAKGTFKISVE